MAWGSIFKGGKKTKAAPAKLPARAKPAVKPAPAKTAASVVAQRAQVSELARVVFQVLAGEQKTYANRQEQAAAWRSARPQYVRMARKIMRQLERRGVQLSGLPPQAKTD